MSRFLGYYFLPFIIAAMLFPAMLLSGDVEPIYRLDQAKEGTFCRKKYRVPGKPGFEVFPVIVDGAIGTTYDNSISLIHFKNGTIKIKVLKKDFSDYVEGVQGFLSPFSNQYMGYIQTRRFLLFDMINGEHKYYNITTSINEHLIDVNLYNFSKKQFVFKIHKSTKTNGRRHHEFKLKIVDLSTGEPKEKKAYPLSKDGKNQKLWLGVSNNMFFLYNIDTKKFEVLDYEFRQTTHPLVELINSHKDLKETDLTFFEFHPKLPFAIVRGKSKYWIVDWKEQTTSSIPIIYRPELATSFSISLDGKWLFISQTKNFNSTGRSTDEYFAMPIDESLPYYVENPVSLGTDERADEVLWTVNPTSLIAVNQFSHITRWVLKDQ
ncbi:MAG: hypothetical protein MJE63_07500 [Proteobacteria bacterium]|nr:hypothetical protein [Pseudomonadota bacterium]